MTTSEENGFKEASIRVAEDFLQTVVVLDDKASLGGVDVDELEPPDPASMAESTMEDISEEEIEGSGNNKYGLDAKVLVEQFAKKGLICAVLKPNNNDVTPQEPFVKAAIKSDIVILDWVIEGLEEKEGDFTRELIRQLASIEQERLRLIVIYTGNPELDEIVNKVKNDFETDQIEDKHKFAFQYGSILISIVAKGGVAEDVRKATEETLPDLIIEDFVLITQGLVSNVALKSFAAIRKNTLRALARFKPALDPAFLTHRILSKPPNQAENHLPLLILSELQAILEDAGVQNEVCEDNIRNWLSNLQEEGVIFRKNIHTIKSEKDAKEVVLKLLTEGIDCNLPECSNYLKNLISRLKKEDKTALDEIANLLCKDENDACNLNARFAMLMSLRNRYQTTLPKLSLGTIVAELDINGKVKRCLICLQPRCDSIRVVGERKFLFLKLYKSTKRFNYLVEMDGRELKLLQSLKPYEAELIKFKAGSDKEITANEESGIVFFESVDEDDDGNRRKFRWIAELKPDHAQRVAHEFGRNISRVGLTESEWMRLKGK